MGYDPSNSIAAFTHLGRVALYLTLNRTQNNTVFFLRSFAEREMSPYTGDVLLSTLFLT